MSAYPQKSSYILRRDCHFYLDQETKIWYTDGGLAVTTLYLSPFEKMLQRQHLINHFSIFGKVENVRIHKKATHSIGFVKFQQAESVSKALVIQCHTIGGCRTKIAIADRKHQATYVHSTNTTGLHIMQLNDDCLIKIFSMKSLSIIDLCSIAETSPRFREIVNTAFVRYRSDLRTLYTINNAERILPNFGSFMSDVWILHLTFTSEPSYNEKLAHRFDSLTRFCNGLESLHFSCCVIPEHLTVRLKPLFTNLQKLHIENCTIQNAGEELFANCRSLVDLEISEEGGDIGFIFENTFPNLKRFKCDFGRSIELHLKQFIPRHRNLKELSICSLDDGVVLIPTIASNCRRLEELHIRIETVDSTTSEALVTLERLKKLKISCIGMNATKMKEELKAVNPLEFLELDYGYGNSYRRGTLRLITESRIDSNSS